MNWYGGFFDENYDTRGMVANIMAELKNHNEIDNFAWTTSNTPYSGSSWSSGITLNGRQFYYDMFFTDDEFMDAMNLQLLEGRWFSRDDDAATIEPVIINRMMKEDIFEGKDMIGETFSDDDREYKVVGVVENYRYRGEFDNPRYGIFERNILEDTSSEMGSRILMRMRPETPIEFEERLIERLQPIVPGWRLSIDQVSDKREGYYQDRFIPLTVFAIVAGFLVFNVALGLFGILWQSINRRHKEIGVRRAFGARARDISKLVWGEAIVMSTFSIIIGAFLAIQVPILGVFGSMGIGVSLASIVAAALLIFILVTVCALYPSRLASKIQPATALHDE
jgi:putative ABC transport system permease protein